MKTSSNSVLIVCNDLLYPAGAPLYALQVVKNLYDQGCELFVWTNHYPEERYIKPWFSGLKWYGSIAYFLHGQGITEKLERRREEIRFLKMVSSLSPISCLVIGDKPRLVYKIAERWTKVVFYLHEISMTCPGDPGFRFLRKSKDICTHLAGISCLSVDRREGCLGNRPMWRKLQRIIRTSHSMKLLQHMKYLVANSSYTAQTVAQGSSGFRLSVVHPTINFDGISLNVKKESPDARFQITFIGRLEEEKGVFEALHILALLPEHYSLVVIGDGSAEELAKAVTFEKGLTNRVAFKGWLPRSAIFNELTHSGLVLVPSLCAEGFNMVGLEALYSGTPVVAYRVGGITDWCKGPFAQCVPIGHKTAAAEAILSMTADPGAWAKLSIEARDYAVKNFNPTYGTEKLFALLGVLKEKDCQ
jgi:glycosyltransferase involved in cell wall biosynthesis